MNTERRGSRVDMEARLVPPDQNAEGKRVPVGVGEVEPEHWHEEASRLAAALPNAAGVARVQ